MFARLRLFFALPVLCLLASCASPDRVSYFDAIAAAPVENVMRVYVDAQGSVYPREFTGASSIPSNQWDGSLFNHYTSKKSPCRSVGFERELRALCAAIGRLPQSLSPISDLSGEAAQDAWFTTQEGIWRARGIEIANRAMARSETPTIVVLFHGFNTRFAEAVPNFATARLIVTANSPDPANLLFVETFWDGCSVDGGIRCWGKAQASGPLAGFFMRAMFNAMNEELNRKGAKAKVRMLSHSSGAFVISSTLGNPGDVLPLLKADARYPYRRFYENAAANEGAFAVPVFDDLAIGLLAPATTVKSFASLGQTNRGMLSSGARLLYAINPDDDVITKGPLGCRPFGTTCMASNYKDYCEYLAGDNQLAARKITVTPYDFKREKNGGEHAFRVYLTQMASTTSFLDDWLGSKDQARNDGQYLCDPSKAPVPTDRPEPIAG